MNPGSPADALPAFQLRNDPGGDRGNELVSKPARKIPFHRPVQPLQMVCTGILSGCIYGILLETTKCTVFFFFLFCYLKPMGQRVSNLQGHRPKYMMIWKNRWKKVASASPWHGTHSPLWAQKATPGCLRAEELGGLWMNGRVGASGARVLAEPG